MKFQHNNGNIPNSKDAISRYTWNGWDIRYARNFWAGQSWKAIKGDRIVFARNRKELKSELAK